MGSTDEAFAQFVCYILIYSALDVWLFFGHCVIFSRSHRPRWECIGEHEPSKQIEQRLILVINPKELEALAPHKWQYRRISRCNRAQSIFPWSASADENKSNTTSIYRQWNYNPARTSPYGFHIGRWVIKKIELFYFSWLKLGIQHGFLFIWNILLYYS
jgi:hypothetical protein